MSDNRATELRRLLDERGVKYDESTQGNTTFFRFDYRDSCGDYLHTIAITGECISAYSDYLTPEQAIAATLGNDDDYELKMDALLCRLTNGKWSKSQAYDLDFMEQCINEEFEMLYAKEPADVELGNGTLTAEQVSKATYAHSIHADCADADWQAIADELNARTERTCRIVEYDDTSIPVCSECGAVQPDDYAVYYCWSCGAKVRNA